MLVYLLVALAFAALAVSLGVLLHRQGQAAAQNAHVLMELREQNDTIKGLLERQNENEASRQRLIDEAVAAIAAEQYRALVAHDQSVKDYLEKALGLLDREVNSPANKEQPRLIIPPPMRTSSPAPQVGPRVPRPAPAVAPQPQPAPAPKPSPCEQRGKSGKCKR